MTRFRLFLFVPVCKRFSCNGQCPLLLLPWEWLQVLVSPRGYVCVNIAKSTLGILYDEGMFAFVMFPPFFFFLMRQRLLFCFIGCRQTRWRKSFLPFAVDAARWLVWGEICTHQRQSVWVYFLLFLLKYPARLIEPAASRKNWFYGPKRRLGNRKDRFQSFHWSRTNTPKGTLCVCAEWVSRSTGFW